MCDGLAVGLVVEGALLLERQEVLGLEGDERHVKAGDCGLVDVEDLRWREPLLRRQLEHELSELVAQGRELLRVWRGEND